jgi:hypothetical protein
MIVSFHVTHARHSASCITPRLKEFYMRRFFVLLVAATLVAAGVLTQSVRAAGDWYVSTNGNDTNDCRSAATACRTIGVAIERADPTWRDWIYVAAGI